MMNTAPAAPALTEKFADVAAYQLRMTERRVTEGTANAAQRTAADAAKWTMRDLVKAEAELHLYTEAANTDRGEARFVYHAAHYLAESGRSTDAFANAAAEAQREGALDALRTLRSFMTRESLLELVTSL
jgi:hypothetical protein